MFIHFCCCRQLPIKFDEIDNLKFNECGQTNFNFFFSTKQVIESNVWEWAGCALHVHFRLCPWTYFSIKNPRGTAWKLGHRVPFSLIDEFIEGISIKFGMSAINKLFVVSCLLGTVIKLNSIWWISAKCLSTENSNWLFHKIFFYLLVFSSC